MGRYLTAALGLAMAGAPAGAAPVAYRVLDTGAYQSFVGNWTPDSAPLCAVIDSSAHWDAVMHPAAMMGGSRRFAPPPETWTSHVVLLIARVIPGGGKGTALQPVSVDGAVASLDVDYRFTPPPAGSYTIKAYVALEIPRLVPATVVFKENGQTVCMLKPRDGAWLSPAAIPQ
jgi:hypothetical protein